MNGRSSLLKRVSNGLNRIISFIFEESWPYWVGGLLLAIVNIIYFWLTGCYWSITTNFARWSAWFLGNMGADVESWKAWNYYDYIQPWLDVSTWSNLGIIIGALISILLARQLKWKQIKDKKQFITALVGGWLMGYGARVAYGCNIGGLFSGIASLGLNGWLYLPFVVLGIFIGNKIIQHWLI